VQEPEPSARRAPSASIVIPTRRRAGYLDVALDAIVPQARQVGAEVLVVSDGDDEPTASVARRHEVRLLILPQGGANAARNAAIRETSGDPIVFVDDDVEPPAGWLQSLLAGVRAAPDRDVFGGPIHARLEGGGPRACGREPAPITTLDLGAEDRDVSFVWSANMAVRRRIFSQVGMFDETISGRGEEEEWEQRYAAAGGRIRYVASAALDHRRAAPDASVTALSRSAFALGRTARRNDVRKRAAPPISRELRTLAGCLWHIVRRRCAVGAVMLAESAGRLREALGERG
jgi:glycosyltransferase involved in cell wall biosynthesis